MRFPVVPNTFLGMPSARSLPGMAGIDGTGRCGPRLAILPPGIKGKRMSEIQVSSWAELGEALYADSWQEPLGRFRSNFAFRGLERPEAELLTGLMRLGGGYADM